MTSGNGRSVVTSEIADVLDELAERLSAGEQVDLNAYRSRVSDPQQLESAFASLRQIVQFRGAQVLNDSSLRNADEPMPSSLADFQLLREIGRGGMGVVYEACQVSLNRRIAVKILPLAGLLNERQLERFRNESRAAAMLKHPNIVRVYSSGVERGVHYYAMDLIDGGTVAELIGQLRESSRVAERDPEDGSTGSAGDEDENTCDPRPAADKELRSMASTSRYRAQVSTDYSRAPSQFCEGVARLGATVCDAVQYAHEQGVIHRDLKPSNLLLDKDGHPYIADFGLAHVQGDASLTATGDRLGTLRYMSPEQAQGRKILDHRTDIYSLGVTLYELLTLRPPFESDDRAELLRRLEDESPPSMRSLAPYVPRDLETIVHKAIAKTAADRYASAQELADDLRRFLEKKPVLARRATWLLRLRRWAMRHRLVASLAATTMLLLVLLSVAGPLAALRYSRLAAREAQARTTSDGLRRELQSLVRDTLTTTMETLENLPGIDPLHRKLVDDTLAQNRKLLALDPTDDQLRLEVANALIRTARVVNLRFDRTEGQRILREAMDLLYERFDEATNDTNALAILADGHFALGTVGWSREDMAKSVAICERLVHLAPDHAPYQLLLGWTQQYLGAIMLSHGDLANAERVTQQAIVTLDRLVKNDPSVQDHILARIQAIRFLAQVHHELRRFEEADVEFRRCLELCEPLLHLIKSQVRIRLSYANFVENYGRNLTRLDRYEEAEAQLRTALRELDEIIDGLDRSDWAIRSRNYTRISLAECLAITERIKEAEAMYRLSIDSSDQCQDNFENYNVRAFSRYNLGCLLWQSDRKAEARELFAAAIKFARLTDIRPVLALWLSTCPDPTMRRPKEALRYARDLPETSAVNAQILGITECRAGLLEQSIGTLQELSFGNAGDDAVSSFYLALAFDGLGDEAAARRWYEKGLAGFRQIRAPAELVLLQREAELALEP